MVTVTPCDRVSQKAKTFKILFYSGYTHFPPATYVVQNSNEVNGPCYIFFKGGMDQRVQETTTYGKALLGSIKITNGLKIEILG